MAATPTMARPSAPARESSLPKLSQAVPDCGELLSMSSQDHDEGCTAASHGMYQILGACCGLVDTLIDPVMSHCRARML